MQVEAKKGDWVQVHSIVLGSSERAPQVPEDTAKVPLEMKVKGSLVENSASVGDMVTVFTAAGRKLTGNLVAIDPPYEVGFGAPPVELRSVGSQLRDILGRDEACS